MVVDQLPRLGKRELVCLLLFTCNYVVSVWRGFLFLWVLGMGYVILLWHSLGLPYNYIEMADSKIGFLGIPITFEGRLNKDRFSTRSNYVKARFKPRPFASFYSP